ncbi:hypothetical protein DPEC_G00328130 [Dallia pectoralis]|uniref:Uncharacterized protein n=1 Tax=Dallia pectoralis TaxID=75939 RepID=A0ACC2F8D0_DALPE|nr:hypothetical protein DPEC_G00328130 [Dallia pectoralis]
MTSVCPSEDSPARPGYSLTKGEHAHAGKLPGTWRREGTRRGISDQRSALRRCVSVPVAAKQTRPPLSQPRSANLPAGTVVNPNREHAANELSDNLPGEAPATKC